MPKFIAAVEVDRRAESKDEQLDRLTRQLRIANARNDKAFDQGAAMVIRALRAGAKLEDIARKIRWYLVDDGPVIPRAVTMEFIDEENTEPMAIPFAPEIP